MSYDYRIPDLGNPLYDPGDPNIKQVQAVFDGVPDQARAILVSLDTAYCLAQNLLAACGYVVQAADLSENAGFDVDGVANTAGRELAGLAANLYTLTRAAAQAAYDFALLFGWPGDYTIDGRHPEDFGRPA